MSKFRTTLNSEAAPFTIDHRDFVLALGSCFSEHIGNKLSQLKFASLLNPFGILYNPISIANSLKMLLEDAPFPMEELFQHQGLWHSFHHHGRFSHPQRVNAWQQIQDSLDEGRQFLKQTNRLLLTFGTAYGFELKATGAIVANCHKRPDTDFHRKRLVVADMIQAFTPILSKLLARKELQIIITVSPVRHIRDGLVENQRSKATLILAAETLCQAFPQVHYFPSYELLLDDLRDYRFYNDDLIHPSPMAIDYVWSFFEDTYFNQETLQLNKKIQQILNASQHRPFHPETPEHQQFIENQLEKIAALEKAFPNLSFQSEKQLFLAQKV